MFNWLFPVALRKGHERLADEVLAYFSSLP